MLPLARAGDSGASKWTGARRQAYANDLDAPDSLVTVTASTNRAKVRQGLRRLDAAGRRPHREYAAQWVGTTPRWNLNADTREGHALQAIADGGCADTPVHIQLTAPDDTPAAV